MVQYLSEDLRIRVIRAIEGGMSRNAAARRFAVALWALVALAIVAVHGRECFAPKAVA